MEINSIIGCILNTSSVIDDTSFPKSKGIYGISLKPGKTILIGEILLDGSLMYIGISNNIFKRDFEQHFMSGKTGNSSVRRALGAILKDELKLEAIPRSDLKDLLERKKYKFTQEGEVKLTNWMLENLIIGYWEAPDWWTKKLLKDNETELTKEFKPALDRDIRTRRFNPYAPLIDSFAAICIDEAKNIAISNDRY